MVNVTNFNFNGKEFRTINQNGEVYFCLADVCSVLELQTNKVKERLNEKGWNTIPTPTNGGMQQMIFIDEPNLYKTVLQSRKPQAEPFTEWVTSEVLPSIRKHGAYMTSQKIEEVLLNPDTIIQLATNLKEEQERRQKAESIIEEQKPKVLFSDSVASSKTSILIGELAKIVKQNGVDLGQNRLFEWMRINGYLIRQKGSSYNLPTQNAMTLGLFEIKETVVTHSDHTTINKTTKVTGKGQVYFVNKLLKCKNLINKGIYSYKVC